MFKKCLLPVIQPEFRAEIFYREHKALKDEVGWHCRKSLCSMLLWMDFGRRMKDCDKSQVSWKRRQLFRLPPNVARLAWDAFGWRELQQGLKKSYHAQQDFNQHWSRCQFWWGPIVARGFWTLEDIYWGKTYFTHMYLAPGMLIFWVFFSWLWHLWQATGFEGVNGPPFRDDQNISKVRGFQFWWAEKVIFGQTDRLTNKGTPESCDRNEINV